jgi:hypothetical protein
VEAARAAASGWRGLPALERGKYLFRIARLIQERARELAVVESLDGGKPIRESRDVDIPLAAAHFFSYAGWADKLGHALGGRSWRPRGVVGQVIPWNFPLLMAAWKLAPALACGNTAVLKPAETTPLTALLLAEICQEAELPGGVVNIVTGDGGAGAALVRADGIDKVAFTGSTAVGKDIQRALAGRRVGLTLELGGKSANIVFEDAALDQAVEGIIEGSSSTRATSAAPARGCCCRSPWPTRCPQVVGAHGAPARRRSAGQEHRCRRDQLACAARSDRGPGVRGRARRARRGARSPARYPRPDIGSRRRCSPRSRRPTGSRSRRSLARWSR